MKVTQSCLTLWPHGILQVRARNRHRSTWSVCCCCGSIVPSNEYLKLIPLRIDWCDLFAVQGNLKSLLQHQSLKLEFCRPEYWSGWPLPPAGDLPNPGIEPRYPAFQANSLPAEPQGSPGIRKEMATFCSILMWEIPWTEEPGVLQSMRSQRGGRV